MINRIICFFLGHDWDHYQMPNVDTWWCVRCLYMEQRIETFTPEDGYKTEVREI